MRHICRERARQCEFRWSEMENIQSGETCGEHNDKHDESRMAYGHQPP